MDRKVGVGFASGGALAIILSTSWWDDPTPEVEPDPLEITTVSPQATPSVARLELPGGPGPDTRAQPLGTEMQRALELVGGYSGEGLIRCVVGELLPEGPVLGLSRGYVEDGLLTGTVSEPEGNARMQAPDDMANDEPRAIVRWIDAWPGEEGRCDVLVPELVPVGGWVVHADGRPVTAGEVGNAVDGTWPISDDGRFEIDCWLGTRCSLAARAVMGGAWGPFQALVPEGPTDGLELILEDPEPQQDLVSYLQEQVAEHERIAEMPDPLRLALADAAMPSVARPVVEAWLAKELAERDSAAGLLDELLLH